MPNIYKCRSYILRKCPHLLKSFESAAVKIESMGTMHSTLTLQSTDFTAEEWEVIKILIRPEIGE